MIEQTATVIRQHNNKVWLATESLSSCSRCSSTGCSSSLLSQLFGIRKNLISLENTLQLKPGQQVVIGIPDAVLVKASLLLYLLPVISMILATILAQSYAMNDFVQIACAVAGFILGLYWVKRVSNRDNTRNQFAPILLRIAQTQMVCAESITFRGKK